jgi:NAD(P)-dependent dehydrogenase (short-subunit alcohol dehydrogenase family)
VRVDVRHDDEVRSLIDQTVARFGRLDVAVNNAGTEGKPGPITEQSAASYAASRRLRLLPDPKEKFRT